MKENKSGVPADREGNVVQSREGMNRGKKGARAEAEGSSLPIRVPPQAFNHPIKRIFTYVN